MINKRIIGLVPKAKENIKNSVILQIISLLATIIIIFILGYLLEKGITTTLKIDEFYKASISILIAIIIRSSCIYYANIENHKSSIYVKESLRKKIFEKIEKLGGNYTKKLSTASIIQMTGEGVDQLEVYFSSYLPQFFYAMISPLLLFIVVALINLNVAIIFLISVPLIPLSIIIVQKIAKKLLGKYWDEYTKLGDHFLENITGLTTLKVYNADEFMHKKMNKQAEVFRKVTMRVLTMQLNSISVMDIMAYGGMAVGMITALNACLDGKILISEVFVIILLSSEFFLPMRLLGSFFHVAMNGMAASKKIFLLLDIELPKEGNKEFEYGDIEIQNMSFSYEETRIVNNINLSIKKHQFISIVGKSGCGKSTIASIIQGVNKGYSGSIQINGQELSSVKSEELVKNITLVSANSYLFQGTIRSNLVIADENASDELLWQVLKLVQLDQFIEQNGGLDMEVLAAAQNLSGGQRQRLALARALLHDNDIYIFDEATSNIDGDSEDAILKVIQKLRETKTILFISHRLKNVVSSDLIYVMEEGNIIDFGQHNQLLNKCKHYKNLWHYQKEEESIRG